MFLINRFISIIILFPKSRSHTTSCSYIKHHVQHSTTYKASSFLACLQEQHVVLKTLFHGSTPRSYASSKDSSCKVL
jgi:hypothetical protein